MPTSLDHQEQLKREGLVPTGAHAEYGRTAADALSLLDKSDLVLLAVTVGNDEVLHLFVAPAAIRQSIAAYKADERLPCEWRSEQRTLTIGSWDAIRRMEAR